MARFEVVDDLPKGRYELVDGDTTGGSMLGEIKRGAVNLGAGLVRGAGSIGATILAPIDMASDAIDGKGLSLESNRQRRADIDAGLTSLVGSDPNSLLYKGGKLGGEIAGTAGTGAVLANGARAVGAAPAVVDALASGGFNLGRPAATTALGKVGDLALRTGSAATVGGVSAGAVSPDQAATGAAIGGALPVGALLFGKVGRSLKGAAKNALGATTGTSAETVANAYQAGKTGTSDFLDNMRGKVQFDDVVDTAKLGLQNMRMNRAADYRSGMMDISKDKSVLDFAPIDDAIKKVQSIGSFKGVQTNKHAAAVVDELAAKVSEWKALDPAEFHTPEGLDALKQAVGDIRDSTQFGTSSRRAADAVYNSVKAEITKQAPTYDKVMRGYADASKELKEIERALSLGDKASKDTAMRKLQSLTRNNANTNYGNRISLANQLEEKGGVSLTPAIAGQSMSTWMPRGMIGAIQKVGGTAVAGATTVNPALWPALSVLPFTSPRLMGELAYKTGRGAGLLGDGAQFMTRNLLANGAPIPQRLPGLLSVAPAITLSSQINRQ